MWTAPGRAMAALWPILSHLLRPSVVGERLLSHGRRSSCALALICVALARRPLHLPTRVCPTRCQPHCHALARPKDFVGEVAKRLVVITCLQRRIQCDVAASFWCESVMLLDKMERFWCNIKRGWLDLPDRALAR